jgi:hypothetical protein
MSIYTTSIGGIKAGWVTTGSIGTLSTGEISNLSVTAVFSTSTVYPKYQLVDGALPDGLTLYRDGTIGGQPSTSASTETFTVAVLDSNNNEIISGEFSVNITQTTITEFTEIFSKPALSLNKRLSFTNFINDTSIFPSDLIYRPFDDNFGKAKDIQVCIDFGVKTETMDTYISFLEEKFAKTSLSLGKVKKAFSKDSEGNIVYELVYVEVIDKFVNNDLESISNEIVHNGITYYPPSIPNIRLELESRTEVTSARNPSFMSTVQEGSLLTIGFISYVPLCFVLPGKGDRILRKIEESGFKFNTFDFTLDRLIVQNPSGYSGAKYLLLNRNSNLA